MYVYLILFIYSVFSSLLLTTSEKYYNNSLQHRSMNYRNKYNKTGKRYYSIAIANKFQSLEELKPLHYVYIKDLYKDRNATVKPFKDKVLAICEYINNKSEFIQK